MTELAQRFERFAQVECGSSPLYRYLALGVAGDSDLLAVAAEGRGGPKPNLLFAAVHYLLLAEAGGGASAPLAAFYPSLCEAPAPPEEAFPAFRSFCLTQAERIRLLLASRRVQTNEVARTAVLLPGFHLIAEREGGRPLALVEVGTSAGLLLLWDRYRYDYGGGLRCGDPGSPVAVQCEARGERRPPLPGGAFTVPRDADSVTGAPGGLPVVAARFGLDLHPIDLRDLDQALWLRALVWPDQQERAIRLQAAIGLARREQLTLMGGDAVEVLPEVAGRIGSEAVPCIFHCHTLNQFPEQARQRFEETLAALSANRSLYRLSMEYAGGPHPSLVLDRYEGGRRTETQLLAYYQAHGAWIEWLA